MGLMQEMRLQMPGGVENCDTLHSLASISPSAAGKKSWPAESGDLGFTPGSALNLLNGLCECRKPESRVSKVQTCQGLAGVPLASARPVRELITEASSAQARGLQLGHS